MRFSLFDVGLLDLDEFNLDLTDLDLDLGFFYQKAAATRAKLFSLPANISYVGAKDGDSLKITEPPDGTIIKGYCSLAREKKARV
ncbi:hypothetical protein ACSBR2_012923 [Camellia fascicularis]